jgi:hypothetical protein
MQIPEQQDYATSTILWGSCATEEFVHFTTMVSALHSYGFLTLLQVWQIEEEVGSVLVLAIFYTTGFFHER